MSYLIITGSFACGMAFHNTAARYMYSMGREGLLPAPLGRTHPKFKSPHIASVVQSVVAVVIIILFAVFTGTNDPNSQAYLQLYGLMAVMGVIIILSRAGAGVAGHPGLLRAAPPATRRTGGRPGWPRSWP